MHSHGNPDLIWKLHLSSFQISQQHPGDLRSMRGRFFYALLLLVLLLLLLFVFEGDTGFVAKALFDHSLCLRALMFV